MVGSPGLHRPWERQAAAEADQVRLPIVLDGVYSNLLLYTSHARTVLRIMRGILRFPRRILLFPSRISRDTGVPVTLDDLGGDRRLQGKYGPPSYMDTPQV